MNRSKCSRCNKLPGIEPDTRQLNARTLQRLSTFRNATGHISMMILRTSVFKLGFEFTDDMIEGLG
ncbi:hypothetical protein D6_00119 [Faustovirus]|nr:hypothetical protein D6_00119 [Faustovirus]